MEKVNSSLHFILNDVKGFLHLIQSYVDSINSEIVPNIETTWERVALQENTRYQAIYLEVYILLQEKLTP